MFFKNNFWTSKNIVFIILAVILLILMPKIISIIMLFFGAYVIACALDPYVNKLLNKMPRVAATSVVLGTTLLAVLALIIPIIAVGINEIRFFMLTFPDKLANLTDFVANGQIWGYKVHNLIDMHSIWGGSTVFAQGVLSQSLNVTIAVTHLAVILVAMTMIVYYIVADKDYLKKKALQFFPPDMKNKAKHIISIISFRVGSYVRAQLISMVAVGIMVTIVLAILKVDYAILLGLISGVLDIIPILGPTIALCIILLVAYPAAMIKILLIIAGFLLCQQLSNYVIKPVLFGKLMQLHPLTIFLALFLATQFLGFWGVILSPAIAATVCVLVDEIYLKPMNKTQKGLNE